MIRVVIVDDHAIVRSGLRQFLSDHVDLRVTGEAADGRRRSSSSVAATSTCC